MFTSIPLFVILSSLCLFISKPMENKENEEEVVMANITEPTSYVETTKTLNHHDEETLMNSQSNSFEEKFKECRKNHASSIGGYALDGCGEFLPAGIEGTIEFFKCAACNCHRNFHRRENGVVNEENISLPFNNPRFPQPTPFSTVFQTPTGYHHVTGTSRGTTTSLPSSVVHDEAHFPRGDLGEGFVEPIYHGDTYSGGEGSSKSKRFRSKFTHYQKERMLGFAMKSGWKINKQDENLVEQFCNEIGVKCKTFRVWMYNNKHTHGNKH
ncbi:putative transcription factor ZF-HD family [Medicago truncatula]|uniref:Homeobox domain, ZF-HD class protein n=1 Tax=Medicago truncatula TaxID=3880 RepID=G7LJ96_MEDTR|nr:zinc-finger homeodomain protein 2 [Medicago truncatula]AET03392.2 homeobox domain, ZF-HD class protein [Medicago truncatula]RHN41592.1 putative transcription factor ZF-HD family [Medicago truncatula]